MKHAELSEHRRSVVVDFLARQTVLSVECVHSTQRKLDESPGRRHPTPTSEVRPPYQHFHQNGIGADVPPLHLDLQVRQCLHELLVKTPHSVAALVVFAPSLVIVARSISESAENTLQVVLVLQSN